MKLTLLLIPLLLFMTSCTIDWNDTKDKKIVELEKQVTELKDKNNDDLFKKKQDCQKQYANRYDSGNRITYENLRTEIFYSEYLNTCALTLDGWNKKEGERIFLIADILAEKTLHSFGVNADWKVLWQGKIEGENLDMIKCDFNTKVQEIKGTSDLYFNIDCPYSVNNQ